MSVYSDVLEAVIGMAERTEPYSRIVIGPLPPDDGISISWAATGYSPFLSKRAAVEMTAVLNAKSRSLKEAADALGAIHTALSLTKEYPSADNFQITDISTVSAPQYLGREENSQWLCGSSLRVRFFLKGE